MTAKAYLRNIKYLDAAINAKQRELDGLRHDAQNVRGVTYDKDKVQSSAQSDCTKIIDRIIDLSNEINSEIDRLVALKAEARERISRVYSQKFISLLTDIYINGVTLEQEAEKLEVNYRTVCRWHGQALQVFRKENGMT